MFWSHWSILCSALWNLICKINLDCLQRELTEELWTRVAFIGKTVWSSSQPGRLEKVEGWGKRKREGACDLSKCHKEANGEVDSQHFSLLSPVTTIIIFLLLFLGIWRMETHSIPFLKSSTHPAIIGSQPYPVSSVSIQSYPSSGNLAVLPKSPPLVEDFFS